LLSSPRFQAALCFSAAALALLFGAAARQGAFAPLGFITAILGALCGVQCLWRDAKRRERAANGRRKR
jgi:hypothetical protein